MQYYTKLNRYYFLQIRFCAAGSGSICKTVMSRPFSTCRALCGGCMGGGQYYDKRVDEWKDDTTLNARCVGRRK